MMTDELILFPDNSVLHWAWTSVEAGLETDYITI